MKIYGSSGKHDDIYVLNWMKISTTPSPEKLLDAAPDISYRWNIARLTSSCKIERKQNYLHRRLRLLV